MNISCGFTDERSMKFYEKCAQRQDVKQADGLYGACRLNAAGVQRFRTDILFM